MNQTDSRRQLATFYVNSHLCGIDVSQVQEVRDLDVIRPDLADYVDGAASGVEDEGVEDLEGKKARHFRGFWADGREFDLWAPEGYHATKP